MANDGIAESFEVAKAKQTGKPQEILSKYDKLMETGLISRAWTATTCACVSNPGGSPKKLVCWGRHEHTNWCLPSFLEGLVCWGRHQLLCSSAHQLLWESLVWWTLTESVPIAMSVAPPFLGEPCVVNYESRILDMMMADELKVMTMTKTHATTKTKWLKDPACAIFLKMVWLKDVKYDDGDASPVMHRR